ncbi:hypothetical protein RI685_16460 (plasmid) [Clavibacter michiganensis]|uniref:hypothetical protein n=1 Tax=Clavibacter michiganensis TaxID=28447 RepID=UPI003DA060E0
MLGLILVGVLCIIVGIFAYLVLADMRALFISCIGLAPLMIAGSVALLGTGFYW